MWRLRRAGWTIAFEPRSRVRHIGGVATGMGSQNSADPIDSQPRVLVPFTIAILTDSRPVGAALAFMAWLLGYGVWFARRSLGMAPSTRPRERALRDHLIHCFRAAVTATRPFAPGQPARRHPRLDAARPVTPKTIAAVVIGEMRASGSSPALARCAQQDCRRSMSTSGLNRRQFGFAKRLDIPAVELDSARPFSAGRGRNEGLDEALRRWPGGSLCPIPRRRLHSRPRLSCRRRSDAGSARRLRDRHWPSVRTVSGRVDLQSALCNRVAVARGPPGNMNGLGGIMVARISAFRDVGGFNLDAIAGEEPDLGIRLALAGYSIIKIDRPMATHDAQILSFGQWWTRL